MPKNRPLPPENPFSVISVDESHKETWNEFLSAHAPGNLLQAYAWGEFRCLLGERVLRYALLYKDAFVGIAQLSIRSPFGFPPIACLERGPIVIDAKPKLTAYFLTYLIAHCRAAKAMQLVIEPDNGFASEALGKLPFKTTVNRQPHATHRIHIARADNELLDSFKSKTRYNIRLAEKKGVIIEYSDEKAAIMPFMELIQATAARQRISLYPQEYYQTLRDAYTPTNRFWILHARHETDLLASLLLVIEGNTAYYLFGGTADQKRELMANFLLHYEAMRFAREQGCDWYDFWGVALPGDSHFNAWQGITRFKLGFQGETLVYPEAQRLVLRRFPWLIWTGLRHFWHGCHWLVKRAKRFLTAR